MLSLSLTIPKSPIPLLSINPRKSFNLFPLKMSSWACKKCTFVNSPSFKSACNVCLSSPPSSPPAHPTVASSSSSPPQWSCKACTFLNPFPTTNCQICDTRKPVLSSASMKELISLDEDELDSAVGSVFMPLRACKRMKVDALGEKIDGFREIKAGDKANSLSLDDDVEKEALTLKIMSYNVWFREDLEVHARMRAIGDLIELHSPDIICLQEVTPDIYELFRSHKWWKGYRCSLTDSEAQLRGYFCMQLSKLPDTNFSSRPFGFSAMGRELCVANAKTQMGQSLVVATSHLESPCPGPPKWDQMFSKERVQQAKEAVNFLKNYPNAIFCGDMNWDDKLDGSFPIHEGWVDAWAELKPGENGWTYDTKSNKMLSGSRTLQKRLDRFLCCFRDFRISDISMIGMEALPDLSYVKEKKVKSEMKRIVLPVLPSDHYGLLMTVTSL